MKLHTILEGGTGSGRGNNKTRPDKNLWFKQHNLWLADMQREHGDTFDLITTKYDEEDDTFATDTERKVCYGVWRKDLDQGITFAKPVPLKAVAGPRMTLKQMIAIQPDVAGK